MKKRFLCLGLAIIMSATPLITVLADREADLRQERAATNSQLEATQGAIWGLEQKTAKLQTEIAQADAELVDVLVAIDVLKEDIVNKEAEIERTKEELRLAEADRDRQYEDMKVRIQYIYENGGETAWAQMLLESGDLSTLLSKAEYTQSIYDYDRERLEEFGRVVKQVIELGERLEAERAELEDMKVEQEAQQAALEQLLAEKRATSADYENRISIAEAQAREYKNLLAAQTAEINRIQEEKRRAAEEAARRAAEEAARREAEQQAARNRARSAESSTSSSTSSSTASSASSSGSTSTAAPAASSNVPYSGTGSSVVNYATQFVGNPYVWGGTSLTNGADCSGFIQSVYRNFGVSLPRSSGEMRGAGVGVPYSEAKPGDIICYSGHVAIYMGGGSIVHASNAKDGIKISGNAAYRTILAVRRVI
jgi:Cell wall-associated hydrolases (invasion-associated proteins)